MTPRQSPELEVRRSGFTLVSNFTFLNLSRSFVSWEGQTRWFQLLTVGFMTRRGLAGDGDYLWSGLCHLELGQRWRNMSQFLVYSPFLFEKLPYDFWTCPHGSQQNIESTEAEERSFWMWMRRCWGSHSWVGKALYSVQPTIAIGIQKNSTFKQFEKMICSVGTQ